MATDDDGQQSPFTRPGFIAAAAVVAVVVVLGLVLVIINATHDDGPAAAAPTTPTASSSSPPPSDTTVASVCGLEGVVLSGTLASAPVATWEYQGVTAFPTSETFGPGRGDAQSARTCFQHSPSGALFAAANALVQATDPTIAKAWFPQFVADGPHRAEIMAANSTGSTQSSDTRLAIAGYRLLAYDGDSARVDVAANASQHGTAIVGSFVYDLVWQAGDWKLSAATATPFNYATIPDLVGYVSWKG